MEWVIEDTAAIIHVEGLRPRGAKDAGEVLWERVMLWWWSSPVSGSAAITAWPVDHPDVPLRKHVHRDREILLVMVNEQVSLAQGRAGHTRALVFMTSLAHSVH